MAAMIEMQIDATKSSANKSVLKDTSRRINAMTLVHEMLYNKEVIETISGKAYLLELVQKMDEMVNDSHLQIDFDIHIDDVDLNISDCVSIGMITSELLSNSIKYAFKGVKKPRITIDLKYNAITKTVFYAIADNGIGFEKDNFTGLGLRLIDIFTRQLNGDYSTKTQNGFCFTFEFKID
jgi:two-component sensor histidine kinase